MWEGVHVMGRHQVAGSNTNWWEDMSESVRVWKGHGWTLQTRGKAFAVPLPALSMTRAQAAHDHFRMQGQKRAVSEARREATASSLRNG